MLFCACVCACVFESEYVCVGACVVYVCVFEIHIMREEFKLTYNYLLAQKLSLFH